MGFKMGLVIDRSGRQLFRGAVPRDINGEPCLFAVRTPRQRAVYAPTLPEALTAAMGRGYETGTVDQRRRARQSRAVVVAQTVQERLLTGHDVSDAERAVLLASKSSAVSVSDWDCEVPLTLVESWFAPYAAVSAPGGRVLWVRPEDEWLFAVSLADAGEAEVAARP